MQWLANICIRRPVFASVLMLVIIVFGALGYSRLGVDQFPNVDIPIVVITTTLPGAAPEEVHDPQEQDRPHRLPLLSHL